MSKRIGVFATRFLAFVFCLCLCEPVCGQSLVPASGADLGAEPEAGPEAILAHRCEALVHFSGLSSAQVQILEPVIYRYKIAYLSSCELDISMPQTMARSCQRSLEKMSKTHLGDGRERIAIELSLECIYRYPGYFYSHPIALTLREASDNERLVIAANPAVEILLPTVKDPLLSHRTGGLLGWHERLPAAIFWLFALLIVFFIASYSLHRRQRLLLEAKALKPPAEPSALELFCQQISHLLELDPQDIEAQKHYYDLLSAALRRYIAHRFSLPALEATSHQIVEMLGAIDCPPSLVETCRLILSESDFIKFGLPSLSKNKNLALLRDTRTLVTALESFATSLETRLQPSEATEIQATDLDCAAFQPEGERIKTSEDGAVIGDRADDGDISNVEVKEP